MAATGVTGSASSMQGAARQENATDPSGAMGAGDVGVLQKLLSNSSSLKCQIDRYHNELSSSDPAVRQRAMGEIQRWARQHGYDSGDVRAAIAAADKRDAAGPADPATRDHDLFCAENRPAKGLEMNPAVPFAFGGLKSHAHGRSLRHNFLKQP